ncbi:MAG TPA: hypothetical protein VJ844_09705 [Mucilaginibacter sp.]|nr:hypothetical protein [Mucilaginibacter sp.]
MKAAAFSIICALIIFLQSCIKNTSLPKSNLPNGDFEGWTTSDRLEQWKTNSCPECFSAINQYVVQKTTEAYHGLYAAKLLYNGVYRAEAYNTFAVTTHPQALNGYVKCTLSTGDTVFIKVQVFSQNRVVDSGLWTGTVSIPDYQHITVPVTQSSASADSVMVAIRGGNKTDGPGNGSVFWVDYFCIR